MTSIPAVSAPQATTSLGGTPRLRRSAHRGVRSSPRPAEPVTGTRTGDSGAAATHPEVAEHRKDGQHDDDHDHDSLEIHSDSSVSGDDVSTLAARGQGPPRGEPIRRSMHTCFRDAAGCCNPLSTTGTHLVQWTGRSRMQTGAPASACPKPASSRVGGVCGGDVITERQGERPFRRPAPASRWVCRPSSPLASTRLLARPGPGAGGERHQRAVSATRRSSAEGSNMTVGAAGAARNCRDGAREERWRSPTRKSDGVWVGATCRTARRAEPRGSGRGSAVGQWDTTLIAELKASRNPRRRRPRQLPSSPFQLRRRWPGCGHRGPRSSPELVPAPG